MCVCSHSSMGVEGGGGIVSGELGWCFSQCVFAAVCLCLFVKGLGLDLGLGLVIFCRFSFGCRG